ncbi:MAG: hypothetical protein Q8N83_16475 [Ignavibacteria bacterium]|nr:hypothetical protein [Ignavibacteria bacterium]
MKKTFLMILLFLWSVILNAQYISGPDTASYKRKVIKGSGSPYSTGLSYNNNSLLIGKSADIKYRIFYQWSFPDNKIPDNSIIDTVEIFFTYSSYTQYPYIAVNYYNVGVDLLTPNMDTLWNRTNYGSNYLVGSGQGNKYGYLGTQTDTVKSVFTAVSNPVFINSFKNSLIDDKFILGIQSNMENYDYSWNVSNYTVTIRVVFSPPQQSVFVDQRLLSNSSVDSVGIWNIGQNKFDKFQAPQTFNWELTSTKVLQSSQNLSTIKSIKIGLV